MKIKKVTLFLNIFTFNNDEFESNYNDIYPDELELKEGNEDSCKA